jgi:hypothetical protein
MSHNAADALLFGQSEYGRDGVSQTALLSETIESSEQWLRSKNSQRQHIRRRRNLTGSLWFPYPCLASASAVCRRRRW